MHNALVLGASGGIGEALADHLEAHCTKVTRLSRAEGLDYDDPARAEATLAALDGPFHTIVIATGALEPGGHAPEKALRQIDATALARHFAVNTIGPALVLKHAPRLLPRGERAVLAALSARVGSIGDNRLGGWHGYRAAKAALNQLVNGAAIELARSHRAAICVALHPGTVATRLTETHGNGHARTPPDEAAANLLGVLAGLTPNDTGRFFDWQGKPVPW
ncbi:MAG: C factor, cell signaling protein [Rhodobacterales bacterium CG2_30_65_12]|nr:MAG: C factor, cell signaling protein [Rhodobacterales bacterium CG2_30_65_12]